jgi:putative phosphoesterase
MKIGVISDAHGNAMALKRCLEYLNEKVDKIFFLGDACGYYPDVNGVVELLIQYEVQSIKGNHDVMILEDKKINPEKDKVYQLSKSKKILSEKSSIYLSSLSTNFSLEFNGLKILMVHASPTNNLHEYVYEYSDLKKWKNIDYDIVLMGHTHRSFIKRSNNKHYINVGSCGLPRDNGNLYSMAILDLEDKNYCIDKLNIPYKTVLNYYPNVHESVKSCLKRNNI